MLAKVRESIRREGLLASGEGVVVGVSGGPDSLCLLHLLTRLVPEYGLRLHVAHLDHGLRGEDARADAEFVAAMAREWSLPCTVEQLDVRALARERRLAVEEAARRARYAFLGRVASSTRSTTIAVGHNADDQAETVLMHWLRGSGLAGLRGMQPRARLGEYRLLEPLRGQGALEWDPWLVRPLLETSREEILAYCASNGLQPRFDLSNLDTTYFRNWLRHTVVPLLAQHNPQIRDVLRRSARVLSDDHALLRTILEETWPTVITEESGDRICFDLRAWRALPASLQRSMLREAAQRLRRTLRDVGFVHIEDAVRVARAGPAGRRATLPRHLMLTVEYDRLAIADAWAPEELPDWPLLDPDSGRLPVEVPGSTRLPGKWVLEADLVDRPSLPPGWETNSDPWRAYLDWPGQGGGLWLRVRTRGDRYRPLGMGGRHVGLSEWLTNRKVSRAVRSRLPLLVGSHGILWVCGHRVDEGARVRDDSVRALVLRFVRG